MCWQFETNFHPDAKAPRVARAVLDAVLTARLDPAHDAGDEAGETAELVVSELVTNAVRAGSSTLTLALHLHVGELRVSVADTASGWPRPRPLTPDSPGGRGLYLVEQMTSSWGVSPTTSGKAVWASLTLPAARTASLPCDLPVPASSVRLPAISDWADGITWA